ncbi:prephenate dehydrogenase (NADP(+)) [Exserohilum turcicum]
MDAFNSHLPKDVSIVSVHSLHGPGIDPKGQPLVLIKYRASDEDFAFVEKVMSCLGSKHVYLSAEQHDRITADTQAVTHAAFLSMGGAWFANNQYPWDSSRYVGGIENVKMNITLRIYSNKWHVYAGLAILNPDARRQIKQYAESVTELFKLMLAGQRDELRERVYTARKAVFGENPGDKKLLLRDDLLDRFALGTIPEKKLKNNHLSLLAMVDCWWKLGIVPYDHMICSTPVSTTTTTTRISRSIRLTDVCVCVSVALAHVARHHRIPLLQPDAPRGSHRHGHQRQHVPRRRSRVYVCSPRLELARQPRQL